MEEEAKFGISPSTAIIISLILGCLCLYMLVKRRWESNYRKRIIHRSESIARLYGGDLSLKTLDYYKEAVARPDTLDQRIDLDLKDLLEEERPNWKKIQGVLAKMNMAGKGEEAVRLLKEAKMKNAELEKSHHVYEIDILLTEMLIYMGKHDEAQKCDCLKHNITPPLDARPPFFRAIIYGMRRNWEKAETFWNQFVERRQYIMTAMGKDQLFAPENNSFSEFKEKVEHLRK